MGDKYRPKKCGDRHRNPASRQSPYLAAVFHAALKSPFPSQPDEYHPCSGQAATRSTAAGKFRPPRDSNNTARYQSDRRPSSHRPESNGDGDHHTHAKLRRAESPLASRQLARHQQQQRSGLLWPGLRGQFRQRTSRDQFPAFAPAPPRPRPADARDVPCRRTSRAPAAHFPRHGRECLNLTLFSSGNLPGPIDGTTG